MGQGKPEAASVDVARFRPLMVTNIWGEVEVRLTLLAAFWTPPL
jgi:hypothetical protein